MSAPTPISWEAALDALEARLAREEAALANNAVDGSFQALDLPSAPMSGRDRVRAQLALQRVVRIEAQLRLIHDRHPGRGRSSPYN